MSEISLLHNLNCIQSTAESPLATILTAGTRYTRRWPADLSNVHQFRSQIQHQSLLAQFLTSLVQLERSRLFRKFSSIEYLGEPCLSVSRRWSFGQSRCVTDASCHTRKLPRSHKLIFIVCKTAIVQCHTAEGCSRQLLRAGWEFDDLIDTRIFREIQVEAFLDCPVQIQVRNNRTEKQTRPRTLRRTALRENVFQ